MKKERRKSYDPTKSFLVHKFYDLGFFFVFKNWVHHLSVVLLRKIRSWWAESKNLINHNIFGKKLSSRKKLLNDSVKFMNFCFVLCHENSKRDRKKFINSETDGPFFLFHQSDSFSFLLKSWPRSFIYIFFIAVLLNFRPWSQNVFVSPRWKMIVGESSAISVIAVAARKIALGDLLMGKCVKVNPELRISSICDISSAKQKLTKLTFTLRRASE